MLFQSDLEIRNQLARCLAKEITLDEFEDWFVARSWNYQEAATPQLLDLVSQIELLLAEFSNGHLEEEQLRRHLAIFVTCYEVDYRPTGAAPAFTIVSSSSGLVSHQNLEQSFDIQFVAVSV